jgi:hypothetical protein
MLIEDIDQGLAYTCWLGLVLGHMHNWYFQYISV